MAHQPCEPEECRALFHHGALFHFHHLLLGLFAERQWVSGGLYCRYGHRQQPPVQEEGNRNFSRWHDMLLQIVMFLMLGLLVNPHEMLPVMLTAVLVSVFMTFVARPLSVWLSLLPFGRKITNKSKLFISWVGIRGAAPIIFATYPVMAQVDGASQIFNIVFFVTLISLLFQGMSLSWVARKLGLTEPLPEKEDNFGIELTEDVGSTLREVLCTEELLQRGRHIRELSLPEGTLVIMIKRGDRYIVPERFAGTDVGRPVVIDDS